MDKIKNPTFIQNSLDPTNNKFVKEIYVKKISKKTGNVIWWMEWQYYKNRGNYSVTDVYKHYNGREARIIYRNEPIIHYLVLDKTLRTDDPPKIDMSNVKPE